MARFEELQTLWQSQRQPALGAAEAARLTRGVRGYERRQFWIYLVKLALVGSIIGWMLLRTHGAAPVVAGVLLIAAAASVLLVVDWRARRSLTRLDFSGASLDFVRRAIAELEKQRDPFRRYYWLFLGSFAIATNVFFAATGHPRTIWLRVAWHAFGTVAPFAGFELGRRVRYKRFEHECLPLIAQLRAVERSLAERET
jgi:Flp pilus assembly protein TadB